MKKQKVMSQMKGQDKTPEKQLNEVETGNPAEKEFRIMTDDTGSRENNREDTRNVYQRPTRTKEQTEMNNTPEGINRRITEVEEWINDPENRMVEGTASEQNREKRTRKKKRLPKRPF